MITLYDQVVDFHNLYRAYVGAREHKQYRDSILKFSYKLEENLIALRQELIYKTYRHGGYRQFIVNDSKKRLIKAAPFRDRVVHHALCNIIEPILEPGFIYDSYACRKGKGTHLAVKRLEKFIRSLKSRAQNKGQKGQNIYCLQCDISKYFDSVDHDVLIKLLERKIKDEDVLWLCREIVASNQQSCPPLPERGEGRRGIPIGNLTSQLFANVYLNELDHFVKRVLHEEYYIRYMDDFLILGLDKKHLRYDKERIRIFLNNQLKLTLHPKKAEIFPIDPIGKPMASNGAGRGVDFLGYVVRDGKRYLRKSTVRRFLKKSRRYTIMLKNGQVSEQCILNAYASWRGYFKFADSYMLMKKIAADKKFIAHSGCGIWAWYQY